MRRSFKDLVVGITLIAVCPAPLVARTLSDAATQDAVVTDVSTRSKVEQMPPRAIPALGVNVRDPAFGAQGDGIADDTAAIQRALDRSATVFVPAGKYRINPQVGLVIRTGTRLVGEGFSNTILIADLGGGTIEQLVRYRAGAIIHRRFNDVGRNDYVTNVYLADFAVLLSHPLNTITTNGIQIGIDMRNVTRSVVDRVHVGNLPPNGSAIHRTLDRRFAVQGYGIVIGTVSSGDKAYAGGELNVVRDSEVWGAYKLIVQDDKQLSPNSGSHATLIDHCDLQNGHVLLAQQSIYTRGFSWRDNILQNVVPQPGNATSTVVIEIEGSSNRVSGGYVEAGGSSNLLVRLGTESADNIVALSHVTSTNGARSLDLGKRNSLRDADIARPDPR